MVATFCSTMGTPAAPTGMETNPSTQMSAVNMVMSARSFATLALEGEEDVETVLDMPDTLMHKLEHCSIGPFE